MFKFDQVAVQTVDVSRDIERLGALGHTQWVRDVVHAVHIHADPRFELGDEFKVQLAFNYELLPGIEFEFIRSLFGRTCQLRLGQPLSHWGYHVKDQSSDLPGDSDPLVAELRRLAKSGLVIPQVSETVDHAGTSKRYRYAFAYVEALGAPVKIIQRLAPSTVPDNSAEQRRAVAESTLQGRAQFAWLRS